MNRFARLWGIGRQVLARLVEDKRGASTMEYALLLALVALVLIGVLTTLGSELNGKIQEIIATIKDVQVPDP